ncbi:MAG: suppressor of fused domain protein [Micromonosporaceae bacterium]
MRPGYDVTDSGGRSYRHPENPRELPPAEAGAGDYRDEVRAHVERTVGPVERVWPELFARGVRIDLLMVSPTRERPYVTMVTAGMSERSMTVPPDIDAPAYAELLLCLPPDWPRTERDWANDANYWPLRTLRQAARMPHLYETWLDVWHTIPNGEPPAPLAAGVDFVAVLVTPTFLVGPDVASLTTASGTRIAFHGVVPLYPAELRLALDSGMEELMGRFGEHRVTELLDPHRADVTR